MDEEHTRREEDGVRKWENHISSIGVAITIGLMMWVSSSLLTQTETIAVLSNEVKHVKEMIESAASDRYTGSQARNDKLMFDLQLDAVRKRLDYLELSHDKHRVSP